MFADANVEISEPIQLDITGVSLAVPSLQIEATTEKGTVSHFTCSFYYNLIRSF